MDIERIKKLSESKIKAGESVRKVRNTLKEYRQGKQDIEEELSEVYKPIVKSQEAVKKKIDEKQDAVLEELTKNQKALTSGFENVKAFTSGLENIMLMQELPWKDTTELPLDYKPIPKPRTNKPNPEQIYKSDLDKGFTENEEVGETLQKYELYPPSHVLKASIDGKLDFDEYDKNLGELTKTLGMKKGNLSNSQKRREANKDEIDNLSKETIY